MSFIDSIPLWLLAILIIGALSIVIEMGYQFGKRIAAERGLGKHPVEASVATAILSLMAFMLGFSFANATARFTARQNLMLEDANTAGTLYLRALIREYVQTRTDALRNHEMEGLEAATTRSTEIQHELWDLAVEARRQSKNVSLNLFIGTLNDLIDTDTNRRTAATLRRFPPTLWLTLTFLGTMSTFMLGFNSGLHGRRSRLATTSLIFAFSVVILLIVDLDRPLRSLFNQQDVPGERALKKMQP